MARARRRFWETRSPFVEGQFSVDRLARIRGRPIDHQPFASLAELSLIKAEK